MDWGYLEKDWYSSNIDYFKQGIEFSWVKEMGEAMQAGIKQLWAGYVISDLRANLATGEIEGCQIVRGAFEYSREGYDYRESRKPWKRLNWLQKANGGRISLKKNDTLGLLLWTMMSFYPSKTPTKCVYLVRLSVFHRSLQLCLYFFTFFFLFLKLKDFHCPIFNFTDLSFPCLLISLFEFH